ncbi:MAG: intradiol ring-cleavage dioxygenase [Rhizobiales bacterium]|nr:intradiol ring-cleavage dioxygenase [Hyphomicrobiales bacterium]
MTKRDRQTRRDFLFSGTIAAAGVTLGLGDLNQAFGQELNATPECKDNDAPTVKQTEGPFFKPRSPERADLIEPGIKGRPLELAGLVLTRACRPISGALVDLWHAGDDGEYDNKGFRFRGHQFSDAAGRYRFRTIVPALYPGRTRHYHVKVQAANRPVLTTQLYFPNEPTNARDGLYRKELLMRVANLGEGIAARFDFVLDMR